MKITPVFDKESQLFVWEIGDIQLPNDIDIQLSDVVWNSYGESTEGQPVSRYIGEFNIDEYTTNSLSEIHGELKKNIFYENIHQAFSVDYIKKYNILDNSHSIIKDTVDTDMGPHWDNFLVFGVFIYNLKDNPNARTTYYDYKTEELIYEGPTKKGTGIFHINSAACLHSGHNKGNEERIISMTVLHVKN